MSIINCINYLVLSLLFTFNYQSIKGETLCWTAATQYLLIFPPLVQSSGHGKYYQAEDGDRRRIVITIADDIT